MSALIGIGFTPESPNKIFAGPTTGVAAEPSFRSLVAADIPSLASLYLSSTLADGKLLVGNGSNVATAVTPSGDVTMTNAGVFTIGSAKVTLAKIANASANSKLVGSGASGSGAAYTEITLGTNLTMSGTTLNAAGGGGGSPGGSTDGDFQFKDGSSFGGTDRLFWDSAAQTVTIRDSDNHSICTFQTNLAATGHGSFCYDKDINLVIIFDGFFKTYEIRSSVSTNPLFKIDFANDKIGFFNTLVVQQTASGASGYASVGGSAVSDADTFTGGTGATAYTIGDIIKALKNYGLLVS